ncbi:MAG: hypothetical protein WDA75_20460, partial [Candidatus Latescibacterota bacterium]
MRRSVFSACVLCALAVFVSISCGGGKKKAVNPDTQLPADTDTTAVRLVMPGKAAEVALENGLGVSIPAGALSSRQAQGVEVTVEQISPQRDDQVLQAQVEHALLAPVYSVDAGGVTFDQPVLVRVPVTSIALPDGAVLADLQVVTWDDSLALEGLATTVSADSRYLEAPVTHFSYFSVGLKKGMLGSTRFITAAEMTIAYDGQSLSFGNVTSDWRRNILLWLLEAVDSPRTTWLNYQVEVLKDGLLNQVLATMHIYRLVWSPADHYAAEWNNELVPRVDRLFDQNGFGVVRRQEDAPNAPVMGIERVVVYDAAGAIAYDNTASWQSPPLTTAQVDSFLSAVFWSPAAAGFLAAAKIEITDPEARYFL